MGYKVMRHLYSIVFLCNVFTITYAQQIDATFSRHGLLVFKELRMMTSHIVDFELLDNGKINVLYESDEKKYIVRFLKNGTKDIQFNVTANSLNNQNTVPVAMISKSDGKVLVLSNFWNGKRWMISINEFDEQGNINNNFGKQGVYKNSIWKTPDDNYGQYIYASSKDEIIIIAKVDSFNPAQKSQKIGILKISDLGNTISSNVYDDQFFTLNCSTMKDDYLLLAYSESVDNGMEKSTYLAGMNSDEMTSSNLHCQIIEEDYQSFDKIVLSDTKLYASQIGSDVEGLYYIRKYDVKGNMDTTFVDGGEMNYSTDIYNTDFVVNKKGEVYVISTSLHSDYELLIKRILPNGKADPEFGENGISSIFMKYPILDLHKIRLNDKEELFISGSMRIEGDSYGFITKLKMNIQQLKKREKLEKFIDNLFVKKG